MFDFLRSLFAGKKKQLSFNMESTAAAPQEVEIIDAAPVKPTTSAGTGVVPTVIARFEDLPVFDDVLTLPGRSLALGEPQRAKLAAVSAGKNNVLVFVVPEAFGHIEHLTLMANAKQTGRLVETFRVQQSVILHLYNKNYVPSQKEKVERHKDEVAPSTLLFQTIAALAVKLNASDMHFCAREDSDSCAVLFRVAGRLRKIESYPFRDGLGAISASYLMAEAGSTSDPTFNMGLQQSCAIPINIGGRQYKLRYQSTNCEGGMDAVYRLTLDDHASHNLTNQERAIAERNPASLGYAPSQCRDLVLAARKAYGVTLINGVTGSGKSTTMRLLLVLDPNHLERKIYMIEQPVESRVRGVTHMYIQQSERAEDSDDNKKAKAYAAAMRTTLRLDPDVVGVGEVRDTETGSLLKTLTHSGHQVLATLHTTSAIDSIERMVSPEIGLHRQTISARNFISALIYQRLIPLLCPHCKLPAAEHMPPERLDILKTKFGMDVDTMRVRNLDGCEHCEKGLQNRTTVVAEVILPDSVFLKYVREDKDAEAEAYWRAKRTAPFTDENCTGKTAFEHGLYKVHIGLIDLHDLEAAFEPCETYEIFPMKEAA